MGGHSGVDIHKNRLNAIKTIFDIINSIQKKYKLSFVDCYGGTVLNSIPQSASVTFVTDASKKEIEEIIYI
ncbi:MAG: peptidase dimerization domain-containing protein [Mycoplasmataceae bacterium]|nr:peptidase dimerization domain-containing protein [Mycoplasmataceae bacterium]